MDKNESLYRIFCEHYDDLFRFCYQQAYYLGFKNPGKTAEDACQEVFVKLDRKQNSLRISTLKQWLCTVSRNHIRDLAKRRRYCRPMGEFVSLQSEEYSFLHGLADTLPTPDETAESHESSHLVKSALEKLTPDKKQVLYLKYYQDYSYEEIAELLKIPMGTVKSRMHRAVEELKKQIQP